MSEVYEIVDRLTGRRATEVVYLTATAALDQLTLWTDIKSQPNYRVQGVQINE